MVLGKHTVWQMVKVAIAFGLIGIVISEVNLESFADLWKRVSVPWFVLSILAFYTSIWLMARRYWLLIGPQVAFYDLLHFVLYQNLVGNLITTVAGAAWYVGILRNQRNIGISTSVSSLMVARFGDLVTLLVSLTIAALIVWREISTVHLAVAVLVFVVTGIAVCGFVLFAFRHLLFQLGTAILDRYQLKQNPFVHSCVDALTECVNQKVTAHPVSFAWVSAYSILILGSMLLFAYSSLQIFGVHIEIWPVIFVVTFTQLLSFLPIQVFGGLGLYDFTYLYLYGLFVVERSEFAAVIVGLRVCYYLANLALLPLVIMTGGSNRLNSAEIPMKKENV